MNKWVEILVGLILIVAAIVVWAYSGNWWGSFWDFGAPAWEFFKGGLVWFVILIGILFLLLGISDLRE